MLRRIIGTGLFLAMLLLTACGGDDQSGGEEGLAVSGQLSAVEVYARMEQAMTLPGQVFHTTIQISQEAGLLSYEGESELWASTIQGLARQISELTYVGGETSRQETVLGDGMIYGPPVRGISPAIHTPPRCPDAGVIVSITIACPRFDRAGDTSVEAVQYEGVAAVELATEVAWSGSDERFEVTRRLYLDAVTFLPIALHFDGTVDYGAVMATSARWTYENDFLRRDSLEDDFFDPASIGYVEPVA